MQKLPFASYKNSSECRNFIIIRKVVWVYGLGFLKACRLNWNDSSLGNEEILRTPDQFNILGSNLFYGGL